MNSVYDFIRSWRPFHVPPMSGVAHVWRLSVDRDYSSVLPFYALLDPEERRRADRFRFPRDAVCSILTRAHLRLILADALGIEASAVRLGYQENGKPLLEGDGGPQFNVSHSGGMALIAVAYDRRVGVDIERIHSLIDGDPALYFSTEEVCELARLPDAQRQAAFFRAWTRKEAYLKARGDGLGFGLQKFSVTLAPDRPPRLLSVEGCHEEPAQWDFRDLPVGDAFSACLVVEAPLRELFYRDIETPAG